MEDDRKEYFANAFKSEARELLGRLDGLLQEMLENPELMGIVGRVFRSIHTIKGSALIFGYRDIAGFAQNLETIYDLVLDGELPVSRGLANLSLAFRDQMLAMLDDAQAGVAADRSLGEEMLEGVRKLIADTDRGI